jgi:hypothetical protein
MDRDAAAARVRFFVDDKDSAAFTDAEILDALTTAQAETFLAATRLAPGLFATETSVSSSANGSVSLSTLDPLRLVQVSTTLDSGARTPVRPARFSDGYANAAGITALKLVYIPKVVFPSSGSTVFDWAGVEVPQLDELLCLTAASTLKVMEAEANRQLSERKAELVESLRMLWDGTPTAYAIPMAVAWRSSRLVHSRSLAYLMTAPQTLQLVR